MKRITIPCALAVAFAVCGARAAEPPEVKGDDVEELFIITVLDAKCPKPSSDGEGAPGRPIKTSLIELYETPETFNCKWVETEGFFSLTNYYDYKMSVDLDLMDAYGFSGWSRGPWFLVASFHDNAPLRPELHRRQARFTGRFFDLCAFEQPENVLLVFGPCHYGAAYLFDDVRVTEHLSPPFQRIKGEANREAIGNLREVPPDWPESANVRAQMLAFLQALDLGWERFAEAWLGDLNRLKPNELESASAADTLERYLASAPGSPLKRISRPLESAEMRLFYRLTDDEEQGAVPDDEIHACVCARASCKDEWPLFSSDAEYLADAYLCRSIDRDLDTSAWSWR